MHSIIINIIVMTVFILKVKGAPVAGCVTVVVALVKGSLTHVKYRLVRAAYENIDK